MTTVSPRCLFEAAQVPAAETALYTAPASTRTVVTKLTVTNTTAGAVNATLRVVPSGGAAGAANAIVSARAVAPGATDMAPEMVGQILNPGDFVSMLPSAVGLTVRVSGQEVVN